MKIVGTAGHVDHGKSTLIAALTGIHPDRLKEEQEREMTIELGFGWLKLPTGEEVGLIDVPGHRDFIGNMLAGIGGIDLVMLVIAADEGVMPQTKEHLAIIDLLQIKNGIVVLTKTDLVDDKDWIELVEQDVRKTLSSTTLSAAPILKVSARNKTGMDDLVKALENSLSTIPDKLDKGKPRLSVDRVFSMAGFGTVVTGTLIDGSLMVGEDVVCLPRGLKGKIRGLQTHNKKEDTASAGYRTAINISGIHLEEIERGDVIAKPSTYQPTRRLDCLVTLIREGEITLKNNTEIKCFIGASETMGVCRTLNKDTLSAGEQGFAQIELREPLIAARGDKLIFRRPSPSETIGGGLVIDPHPSRRHKRYDQPNLQKLTSLLQGDPADVLFTASLSRGILTSGDLIKISGLASEVGHNALTECLNRSTILLLDDSASDGPIVINAPQFSEIRKNIEKIVLEYHANFPLRKGMPKEEIKSRLKLTTRHLNLLLPKVDLIELGSTVKRPDHAIIFSAAEKARFNSVTARFKADPYSPPSVKDAKVELGDELYNALLENGDLTQVSPEVVFKTETYQKMEAEIRQVMLGRDFSAAEVRDLFGNSRKYALAFLEYLDLKGITVRNGDSRRLK